MRRKAGFTLVELVVVLALAGVILALLGRTFVLSAKGRDQLAGFSQLKDEVSAVVFNLRADAERAGSLSLSPEVAWYLAENWPAGEDTVFVEHGDEFDTLTFRWAEAEDCPSGEGYPVSVGSVSACIRETTYEVDSSGRLLKDDEPLADFEVEAFRVFWGTADGWQWERPAPEEARAIAVYLRASVPYREPVSCGTYPSPGVLDPYGSEIKDEIEEETLSGNDCYRLVRETVAEFPLVNLQHW